MAFISDYRLLAAMVMEPKSDVVEVPNLVLLDASIPEYPPATPGEVRFVCDPRYRGMRVRVITEGAGYGDFSEVMGQDVPFYPDPSQRVLALLFYLRTDVATGVQGICLVHSEALLRLASEKGEGVVEWETWGKFTVSPNTGDVPRADSFTRYSVSGGRFARVGINEAEGWANIRVYDLSHWTRQYPNPKPDGDGESGEKTVRYRVSEAVWKFPQTMRSICHVAMQHDCVVISSVRLPVLCFGLRG
jgi:hypothetical protein